MEFYSIPSGYRKIPGTHCKGGLSYEPVQIPCPKVINEDKLSQENRLRQMFLAGAALLFFIALLLYIKYDTLRNNVLTSIQNIKFIMNKRHFDYSKFENDDAEVDFSKMVFEDTQEAPEILE